MYIKFESCLKKETYLVCKVGGRGANDVETL